METLHRCMVKATTSEAGGTEHKFSWALARRGILEVTDQWLALGDWKIRYEDMEEAILLKTRQMFIPGYVLRVRAKGVIYHFGLNWNRFWGGDLPFPVERKRGIMRHTWFSLAVRGLLLVVIVYWIWVRCVQ